MASATPAGQRRDEGEPVMAARSRTARRRRRMGGRGAGGEGAGAVGDAGVRALSRGWKASGPPSPAAGRAGLGRLPKLVD